MLKQGLTGNAVAALQFALNRAAQPSQPLKPLVCDGIFGPLTLARVVDHQQRKKLVPDGIAGPLTLDTLFQVARLRSTLAVQMLDPPRGAAPSFLPPFARNGAAPRSLAPLTRPEAPRTPRPGQPSMADWLNPTLAEMARQQEAFRAWWDSPHPKPPLPAPKPYPPQLNWDQLPHDFTWLFPSPKHWLAVTPPSEAMRNVPVRKEGVEIALKVESGGEGPSPKPSDPTKPRPPKWKIFELESELKALLMKCRYTQLAGGGSVGVERTQVGKLGEVGWKAKGFLSLSPGKLELGTDRLTLETAGELAVAVGLESAILAAEVEVKGKTELQLQMIRVDGETGLYVGVGIGVGGKIRLPIWSKHPGRDPDEEKIKVSPLTEGFFNFTYRFR
jgi:hypothetical protein